ncbi:MAG TPA: hypothetical protein VMS56_09995 [Thermoanaerobaculia bacterium]|nr:hypothetical protein [Thermoanaerobaculia bacterium]
MEEIRRFVVERTEEEAGIGRDQADGWQDVVFIIGEREPPPADPPESAPDPG